MISIIKKIVKNINSLETSFSRLFLITDKIKTSPIVKKNTLDKLLICKLRKFYHKIELN